MSFTPSRRSILAGAATASLLAACKSQDPKALAEQKGAFPDLPKQVNSFQTDFLGPKPSIALLKGNENPYGPSKSALDGAEYAAKKGAYYPIGADRHLASMIAERHGLAQENIVISTGSAEALCAIAVIYGQKGLIVAPRLFFDATPLYAQRLGLAEIQRAPMGGDLSIDLPALEAMVTPQTGLVQICNPNNPTGLLSDRAQLKPAVKRMAKKATVVVDEAYMELADNPEANSCIDLVKQGHDVIVSRTFSKIYGMAGLRVGYIIAAPDTAKQIDAAKMSWMSGVGLAAAMGCYNDESFLKYSISKIIEAREMVTDRLQSLDLEMLPSQTNFIYFKSGKDANEVQKAFAQKNILIRGQYMDYNEWTRVSMGHLKDVERFCDTLPEIIGA